MNIFHLQTEYFLVLLKNSSVFYYHTTIALFFLHKLLIFFFLEVWQLLFCVYSIYIYNIQYSWSTYVIIIRKVLKRRRWSMVSLRRYLKKKKKDLRVKPDLILVVSLLSFNFPAVLIWWYNTFEDGKMLQLLRVVFVAAPVLDAYSEPFFF